MNIEIHLHKTQLDSDPEIGVQFGVYGFKAQIGSRDQKLYLKQVDHHKDGQLVISRNETYLYQTGKNHHVNKVVIDKVIVDDFWEFDPSWYTPESVLDDRYKNYVKGIKRSEWIEECLVHNSHIFFNGKLVWNIKYPVRRSFFEDRHR